MSNKISVRDGEYFYFRKALWKPLVGLIFGIVCSWLNFLLIQKLWGVLDLQDLTFNVGYEFVDLSIIPLFVLQYFLIGFILVSLVALIKGGYSKIKKYEEFGLIVVLIGGIIIGLIYGLIGGLIGGLIYGLIGGLIIGLIYGVIAGLLGGIIIGLGVEFE